MFLEQCPRALEVEPFQGETQRGEELVLTRVAFGMFARRMGRNIELEEGIAALDSTGPCWLR